MVQARDRTTPVAESPLTLAEFLEQPETKPASEFIRGKIQQKPMPKGKHSYLQLGLAGIINAALRKARIARPGPELRCTFGGRSIVPDIAVFEWDNIPRDQDGSVADAFDRAPDWTIEIMSPDQSPLRSTRNILHCLDHGCAMGWLIVPEDLSVVVYEPTRTQCFDKPGDSLPVPEFAGDLEITIQDLMDCLQD
ncbi:MAG: Uma2 family endonuclease [Cyanobacteria bacterium P01_C01_bin.89]